MTSVGLSVSGPIAVLTISSPARRNAMTPSMWKELNAHLTKIAGDSAIRVAVLTGDGQDFCSGTDLTHVDPEVHPLHRMQFAHRTVLQLHNLPIPTIAKVDGYAVGIGCNLALGCDLVIASHRARFSEIFIKRALSIDGGASWLLPRLVGLHRAKEICFFGEMITADAASELGLVYRVVDITALDEVVDGVALRLADSAAVAIQQTKMLLNAGVSSTFEQALDNESRAQAINLGSSAQAQAAATFRDGTAGSA